MVPVTQMPPNSAEPMLAKPCATSSQLERWLRPVMPSATTAESSDSIAPSKAKATASGSTAIIFSSDSGGSCGSGSVRGNSPNWLPMVATGRCKSADAIVTTPTAIRMPGHVGRMRRMATISTTVASEAARARVLKVGNACASVDSLCHSAPLSPPGRSRPSRSRTWLTKMMMAMPVVKPTVTG